MGIVFLANNLLFCACAYTYKRENMSDNIPKYKATDKMSDLIWENYTL